MKHLLINTLFCALFSLVAGTTLAASSFNESVSGDVSNDPQAPTLLNLSLGTNSFIATMHGSDIDFVTVDVPANHQLSGLIMAGYDSIDEISFIAVGPGSQLPASIFSYNVAGLTGYLHFGPGQESFEDPQRTMMIGEDMLPALAQPRLDYGLPGFSTPMPAGRYTFWIQQESFVNESYQLDFVVTPIPEPSTLMLLSLALGGTITFRRGRR